MTPAETSARYHVVRERSKRGAPTLRTAPAYATDGIAIPRRKRRILLDLAPETVAMLLEVVRSRESMPCDMMPGEREIQVVLVQALEKAR